MELKIQNQFFKNFKTGKFFKDHKNTNLYNKPK